MKNTSEAIKEKLLQQFAHYEAKLNGLRNSDLFKAQKAAIENFKNIPLPTSKHEEWKYTNPVKVLKDFEPIDADDATEPTEKPNLAWLTNHRIENLDALEVVFWNGKIIKNDLDGVKGVTFGKTVDVLAQDFAKGDGLLNAIADSKEPLVQLNAAKFTEGYYFEMAPNAFLEKPVVFYQIESQSRRSYTRNLFRIGENAEGLIYEVFLATDDAVKTVGSTVTEGYVHPSGKFTHHKIQNRNSNSSALNYDYTKQAQKSGYTYGVFTFESDVTRNFLNIIHDGEYCESGMYGLYMLNGKSHVDNRTQVDHAKPNCLSDELYKGVLDDSARGVFNGKIMVWQDAQKTNAYQTNRNILLSDKARIDTKPQLEIFADDVKCSHGATTGMLDEEALFYLRARGISKDDAKALMIKAFASKVISKIKHDAVYKYLGDLVDKKLFKK